MIKVDSPSNLVLEVRGFLSKKKNEGQKSQLSQPIKKHFRFSRQI